MPLIPLYGHADLRARLQSAIVRQSLPASLLLQGPAGAGKQRLALSLGRALVCDTPAANGDPCEQCQSCRFSRGLTHPDLHWFFPIERPKDADQTVEEVLAAYAEFIAERVEHHGLYERPSGEHGLFIATVRAIVQSATKSPAIARRKVFIVGDAERMVSQEGSEQAANAFLKLLEEPPADTHVILTSSEAGALLPTIRSRVVSVRVAPLAESEVREFLDDARVRAHLQSSGASDDLIAFAAGAPGRVLIKDDIENALEEARRLLDAAASPDAGPRHRAALSQGGRGARGRFTDTLEALTALLHERARSATRAGASDQALRVASAVDAVERAKEMAMGNVNPQLIAASLLRQLSGAVR